jgi:trimeric autotransporter adhesin
VLPIAGSCGTSCPDPLPLARASILLSGLSVGTHTFTAVYSGEPMFAPSTSAPFTITVQPGSITAGASFGGPTATATGNASVTLTGGGALCGFTRGVFIPVVGSPNSPPAGSAPPGVFFPDGLIDLATSGCTPGSTLTFMVTLPHPVPAGVQYWKYGPTPDIHAHWYTIPAFISGNTITFNVTDGGTGDDDLTANGTVVDQGGPGVAVGASTIPTLGSRMIALLAGVICLLGLRLAGARSRRV